MCGPPVYILVSLIKGKKLSFAQKAAHGREQPLPGARTPQLTAAVIWPALVGRDTWGPALLLKKDRKHTGLEARERWARLKIKITASRNYVFGQVLPK